MLCLIFQTKLGRFAVNVQKIAELTPLVGLSSLPLAPDYVAGLMDYRGQATPVIDLGILLGGKRSLPLLSTRIIIVDYPLGENQSRPLGLMAELATETGEFSEADFASAPLKLASAPYLEAINTGQEAMLTLLDPLRILPEELKDMLFREPGVFDAG